MHGIILDVTTRCLKTAKENGLRSYSKQALPKVQMKNIFLLIFMSFTGCAGLGTRQDGALQQVLLVWLKHAGTAQQQAKIIEVSKSFRDIPGVLDVQAGKAVASDRGIVDDSFDVGILVVVPDERRLREHLDHPIHQKAKNDVLLPLVEKILVYDFQE